MKWAIAILILLVSIGVFTALRVTGIIVLTASPERCAKLKSALTEQQIAENQKYWDKRCGYVRSAIYTIAH